MSMRQAKKLLQKEDEMEAYRKAVEEEKLESKQTKKRRRHPTDPDARESIK